MPSGVSEVQLLVVTTEVEIYDDPTTGKPLKHFVYLDWKPGDPLPQPIGAIDADEIFEGHPEIHVLRIRASAIPVGKHTLTIQVNPDAGGGFKDDFVLKRIEIAEDVGAKIGW